MSGRGRETHFEASQTSQRTSMLLDKPPQDASKRFKQSRHSSVPLTAILPKNLSHFATTSKSKFHNSHLLNSRAPAAAPGPRQQSANQHLPSEKTCRKPLNGNRLGRYQKRRHTGGRGPNMKKHIFLFSLVLFCFALIGCSNKTVVLVSEDGSRELVYERNNFHPQVQTSDDIAILVKSTREVLAQASANHESVTCQELMHAAQVQDWRKMEKIVFDYKCTHD